MKLHWSPRSPFVRKVMVAAHELGLAEKIECVRSVAAMGKPNPAIMVDNPVEQDPGAGSRDGTVLIDSAVIVEYLDSLAGGGRLLAPAGRLRWLALSRQALADGLLDLLVLWRNEREKPAGRQTHEWLDAFAIKAAATLDRMEAEAARWKANRSGSGTSRSAVRSPIWTSASPISSGARAGRGWRRGRPRLRAPVGQGDGDRRWLRRRIRARSIDAHPRARPRAHHGGAVGDADSRRPRRRRHQDRAAGRRRRYARLGSAVPRDREGNATGESGYFLSVNRGKRSVAVDIATVEGQQLIRAMAQQCDVVIENFKVGALAKYGLDAASLRGLKPVAGLLFGHRLRPGRSEEPERRVRLSPSRPWAAS
jgi:glutathione S-transferase